jgi:hypothetical protein
LKVTEPPIEPGDVVAVSVRVVPYGLGEDGEIERETPPGSRKVMAGRLFGPTSLKYLLPR